MIFNKLFKKKKKEKDPNHLTWYDITVEQFNKIKTLDLSGDDMADQITCAETLLGIDAGDMKWSDFVKECGKLEFLKEKIPEVIIRFKYEINGRMYNCVPNLGELNVARYMDFINLAPKGELHKILAVFLIPEGENYGDNLVKVYNDILKMNIVDAYAIFNFFKMQFIVCCKTMKDYLVKEMKGDKDLQKVISATMDCSFMLDQ